MKSVTITLWIMLITSITIGIGYLFEDDVIFGIIIFIFSTVFLLGFRELGKPSYSYRIAHIYVGSILIVMTAGYILASFLFSLVNLIIGEEIMSLKISDMLLLLLGVYSSYNIYRLRKTAIRPEKKNN
ncbi:MAG TPA: hypothetical protein PK404_01265 [Fervidobacterium sp.]|nr:hypothetical protein [Fervidobacterium sp.]HOM73706.1 hypothetical protein [Fervidobacterium sp.]HRD19625.1 hypothetical protein [Fervidobacterium sp.]